MSANNQTLIKEHKGKWYVFTNIQAESWCDFDEEKNEIIGDKCNELSLSSADGVYETRDEAFEAAGDLDDEDPSEYGVQFNRLCKDDAEIKIIEKEKLCPQIKER